MKRGLLWVVLLLSLGFNLGVVASLLRGGGDRPRPSVREAAGTDADVEAAARREEPSADAGDPPETAEPAVPGSDRVLVPSDDARADAAPAAASPEREPQPTRPAAPPARPPNELRHLVDRLGLAGDERAEFIRLQQRLARRVRATAPQIERARNALAHELSSPEPDRAAIERHIAFTARATAELERAFAETALATRELLDPVQEELYLEMLSRRLRAARAGGNGFGQPPRRGAPPARRPGP